MSADTVAIILAITLLIAVGIIVYQVVRLRKRHIEVDTLVLEKSDAEKRALWFEQESKRLSASEAATRRHMPELESEVRRLAGLEADVRRQLMAHQQRRSAPQPAPPTTRRIEPTRAPQFDAGRGKPPVEPERLPSDLDFVADSEVDGATHDSLVIRAAAVRGDRGRHEHTVRTDAYVVRELGEGYRHTALASIVASGPPLQASHAVTALACRRMLTQLGRRGASLDAAWRAENLLGLREILGGAWAVAQRGLTESAREQQSPAEVTDVEITCLLTDLTDRTTRRHLVFRYGGGNVLSWRDTEWTPVLPDISAQHRQPGSRPEPHVHLLHTDPGDILVVTTRAGVREFVKPEVGTYFGEQWKSGHGDLVHFLQQVSARIAATDDDRTVICLWDLRPSEPNQPSSR